MSLRNALAAAAVAATTLAALPPAQAQTGAAGNVTVYGLLDTTVRRANNITAAGAKATGFEDGVLTGTRLGLRGTEDLGGGWRALFNIEAGFALANGQMLQGTPTADYGQDAVNPRFWGREAWVGASSARWGELRLGRQYTVAHALAARFQPQGNPNNLAYSLFSSHHIARQDRMARYTARLGKFELLASHTFGPSADATASGAHALGLGYADGPLSLGAYVQEMNNLADTETRKVVGLGGNVRVNPMLALYAGWMQRSAEVSVQKNKAWTLGANIELNPATTLSLAWFDDQQGGSAALEGSRQVRWAMLSYRFSRRTDAYLTIDHNAVRDGYAKPAFMGTKGTQDGFGAGLRHRF